MEQLTEDIDSMQQELRACLRERADLEAKKNDLQNTLTNNLLKTKMELQRELEEISLSEKKQQLEMTTTELSHLDGTIVQNQERYGGEMRASDILCVSVISYQGVVKMQRSGPHMILWL